MNQLIRKLPDEIEYEIKNLVLTKTMHLTMLLDKYPLENLDAFLEQFSTEQLDRIYRYGCVSKVLQQENGDGWYTSTNTIIKEIFGNQHRYYGLFTHTCWPDSEFQFYWQTQTQTKKSHPSKPEYIRRIKNFCYFAIEFSNIYLTENKKFSSFCEKLVYDVIVGSLIMLKNK